MTTLRVASDLASVLVPIGYAGAALAVLCAIVAAVAIVRGAGGLTGGAVGVWIVGALMSFTASFGNQWLPLIIACASLGAMLVIGGVVRGIMSAAGVERAPRATEEALPLPVATAKPAPVAKAAAVVKAASKSAPTAPVAIVS